MDSKNSFEKWIDSAYSSPKQILINNLSGINQIAEQLGARIELKQLQHLSDSHFLGRGDSFYIPNRQGVNDQKQYAMIRTGYTGNNVAIPLVIICSYKASRRGTLTYSPAQTLWQEFRREQTSGKKNLPQSTSSNYRSSFELSDEEKARQEARDEALARSVQAAANQAINHLLESSDTISTIPSQFHDYPLDLDVVINHGGVRMIRSSVTARLYSRSKGQWFKTTIAYPRDIIVPVYRIEDRALVNCQIISARPPFRKMLIAGAPVSHCGVPLIFNNAPTTPWLVSEGVKTGYAIGTLAKACLNNVNVFCAMSANNIPKAICALSEQFPEAPLFSLPDNDDEGIFYAKAARNSNGAEIISAPDLYQGSDWASSLRVVGLERTIASFRDSLPNQLKDGA
ncbi:TPA: hypothetical protein I7682_17900 [Vibrio vulnificus]|nr:hypothetical protein [Vibrio vulnificus]